MQGELFTADGEPLEIQAPEQTTESEVDAPYTHVDDEEIEIL